MNEAMLILCPDDVVEEFTKLGANRFYFNKTELVYEFYKDDKYLGSFQRTKLRSDQEDVGYWSWYDRGRHDVGYLTINDDGAYDYKNIQEDCFGGSRHKFYSL